MSEGTDIMNSKRAFQGLRAAMIATAAGLVVAACNGTMPSPEMASAKVPVVQQTMLTFDLGGSGGGLSSDQRRSLSEWFDSIGVRYGDRVSVDDNGGGAGVRRAAVADVLADFGLLLTDHAPATAGSGSPRVVVLRATATAPGCPDFSRPSNPELEASKMSNYGCATAGAYAAMVVDANDLVAGKSHGGTDAITVSKAIDTYRNKAALGTNKVTNTVGSASGSGSKGGN